MREMELTTLLTEVQDIQKFTKNKRQKKWGFAGVASTIGRFFGNIDIPHKIKEG